ncbi:hypothetical protein AB0P36_13055 [Streptomyces flavidovirens]|uniref:hypothetical protein n=1 Tax=Streptomyces flavidovirens TaxID=67298 RepID=UPI00344593E7
MDRFEGMGVTGMEDEPHYGLSFYHTGTAAPSFPLPAGTTSEPRRGSLMNIGPLWIRHAIVGDPAVEPYLFDLRPHARRIQTCHRCSTPPTPISRRWPRRTTS